MHLDLSDKRFPLDVAECFAHMSHQPVSLDNHICSSYLCKWYGSLGQMGTHKQATPSTLPCVCLPKVAVITVAGGGVSLSECHNSFPSPHAHKRSVFKWTRRCTRRLGARILYFEFEPILLVKKWTEVQGDRLLSTFPSHTSWNSHRDFSWSHFWSVSANSLYQPTARNRFHWWFCLWAEQKVFSFLLFFPHPSISVIALFPAIERSCVILFLDVWNQ